MCTLSQASLAAAALLSAAPAFAQTAPPAAPLAPYHASDDPPPSYIATGQGRTRPGAEEHDGFFLRFHLGPGYATMGASAGGTEMTIKGPGYGFSLALGGAVTRNLIVYGELVNSGAVNPDVELEIEGLGSGKSEADGSANIFGFGPGVAYYFGDNLYVSGTLAFTQLRLQDDEGEEIADTKYGVGASLSFGKEWWVSENWGLGAALRLQGASMKDRAETDEGERLTWRAFGINLLFSATFN